MEYTKDIILNLSYKNEIAGKKIKNWTNSMKKVLKNHKLIIGTLATLCILISIDLVLVNSFLEILSNLY